MSRIRKCGRCSRYTLKEMCPLCGAPAISARPARFSPEDPYGKYRRALKFRKGA